MHDLLLDNTTNVASFSEYTDRYTTKTVEGKPMVGYFVEDFTVAGKLICLVYVSL